MSTLVSSDDLPTHLALIMDGNGRWAHLRKKERFFGHVKGARVAKSVIEHCAQRKLKYLTLYTFSEENWSRPPLEISFLMRLLLRYIRREKQRLHENNIQVRCVGQLDKIPSQVLSEIKNVIALTKNNTGMVLTFALSYGGRQEILKATQALGRMIQNGDITPDGITEDLFERALQTYPNPDPDLLIRTSGEWRLSNFLTWQSVYTELYFSKSLWPDFSTEEVETAFRSYLLRERRFGKVSEHSPSDATKRHAVSELSVVKVICLLPD